MSKYLLKIQFDCNDADYVYGCQIIDEKLKKIIDENGDKLVSFGSYDFGDAERTIDESMTYIKITDKEAEVIKRLGLVEFGENWNGEFQDSEEDEEDEEEEDNN